MTFDRSQLLLETILLTVCLCALETWCRNPDQRAAQNRGQWNRLQEGRGLASSRMQRPNYAHRSRTMGSGPSASPDHSNIDFQKKGVEGGEPADPQNGNQLSGGGNGTPQRGSDMVAMPNSRFYARALGMPYAGFSTFRIRVNRPLLPVAAPASVITKQAQDALVENGRTFPLTDLSKRTSSQISQFISRSSVMASSSSGVVNLNKSSPKTAAELRLLFGW